MRNSPGSAIFMSPKCTSPLCWDLFGNVCKLQAIAKKECFDATDNVDHSMVYSIHLHMFLYMKILSSMYFKECVSAKNLGNLEIFCKFQFYTTFAENVETPSQYCNSDISLYILSIMNLLLLCKIWFAKMWARGMQKL